MAARYTTIKFGTPKKVRLSYANIFTPREADAPGGKPKYTCMLMIPKTDKETIAAIKKATRDCYEANPAMLKDYDLEDCYRINDGDGKSPKGKRYGDECHGYWLLNVSSTRKPTVIGRDSEEILDPEEVYSGCWAKVGLTAVPYARKENTGITFSLDLVKKMKDDDHLGGGGPRDEKDYFGSTDDDDEDDI